MDRFVPLLQWTGIVAPTLYAGITAQHSASIPELVDFAPPKILARQWLQLYQRGPTWVAPLVLGGSLANALLASRLFFPSSSRLLHSSGSRAAYAYAAAALAFFSLIPITVLGFEPGVNGACKLKVESVLADEGFRLAPPGAASVVSAYRHTATESAARWAESASLAELVRAWGRWNNFRWAIAGIAAVVSGLATFGL